MTSRKLLEVMEDLNNEDFHKFIWCLRQPDLLEGYYPIRAYKLENKSRLDTVTVMVEAYGDGGALEITKKVLKEIWRNDLVEELSRTCQSPEGSGHRSVPLQRTEATDQRGRKAESSVSAEDQLSSVRREFVNRVSGPVLDHLLDELLHHEVINGGEMESVKTITTRGDKARCLIDTVRRKGSEASSVLISALCQLDPWLCKELKIN